jgi:hypothetical protein
MGFPDHIKRTVQLAHLPEDTYRKAFDGHTEGWRKEPGEMAAYLDAA